MSNLPASMKVITISKPGGPEVLAPAERPLPAPKAGEVLVKVAATGVNGPDMMQRKGLYPAPAGASDLLGLEISGEVVAAGSGVTRWKTGDQLCGLTNGGGKAFGAKVIATDSPATRCQICRDLGADRVIDYKQEDFVEVVRSEGGANVILDIVGGPNIEKNIKAASPDARIIQLAFAAGSKVEINLMPIMLKRLIYTGSTLRTRPLAFKTRVAQELETTVWPLIAAGKIRVVTGRTFTLAEASEAHAMMESAAHTGKILLTLPST